MQDDNNIVLHGEYFAPIFLDQKEWGSLILDLILSTDSEEKIAEAYELDLPGLEALKKHPPFAAEYSKAQAYVKSLGPDGGFKLRARAIAESKLSEMATIIGDKEVHPSVRASLWRDMVKYGDLDPATQADKNKGEQRTGPLVQINMGGLMHLNARPVIDVKPE